MNTWSNDAELTEVRGGGTFKHPLDPNTRIEDNLFTMMTSSINPQKKAYRMVLETFKNTKFNKEDIDWFIFHISFH